jgi:hypothetical protein
MSADSARGGSRLPWILLAIVIAAWVLSANWERFQPLRDQIVTTQNATSLRADVRNATDIADADKAAFERAFTDYNVGSVEPYGKTVSAVMATARAKVDEIDRRNASEAAARASKAAIRAKETLALENDLEIRPARYVLHRGSHTYGTVTVDAPSEDVSDIDFTITNRGAKTIRSFSASATLTNKGGEEIYAGTLADEVFLRPGAARNIQISHTPSVLDDDAARNVRPDEVVVKYTVTKIWYADGSTAQTGE